jgi:5'(3')-deoxyribonucleotidase
MRFGIDLDGVLADFGARIIEVANKLWPGKLAEGYVPASWDYTDVFSKEDWSSVWEEVKRTPYFWRDEQEQGEGANELSAFLMRHSEAEVYYITSRIPTAGSPVLAQSSQWLRDRGLWPRRGYSTVIPVADPKKKADVLQALKLPFFLDDYAVTVQGLQTIENLKTYVLDQPWNRYATHLPRVFSVAEYLHIVENS